MNKKELEETEIYLAKALREKLIAEGLLRGNETKEELEELKGRIAVVINNVIERLDGEIEAARKDALMKHLSQTPPKDFIPGGR